MNAMVLALCLCSAELMLPNRQCEECDLGVGGGEMSFKLINSKDPCYRGTMFNALKITRAYRDNQAFAFHHFEDKRLTVSGRLVAIKQKRLIPYVAVDPVTKKAILKETPDAYSKYELVERDAFVALVTPDGKFPQLPQNLTPGAPVPELFGLEFRFPLDELKNNPQLRCDIAALWAGQFVTLKGDCRGAYPSPEGYTAIIFENTEIVK
jgi:hypothetical protein